MDMNNEKSTDLFGQFARVEWLLHRYHQHNHRAFGPMGDIHRGQGRVLALLKMQPEISQKDLSFLLDMRPQSIGELLAKLEKNGYITRTQSEADRRIVNIKLTEAGEKATEQQHGRGELFDCLAEEERETLSVYLDRIIAHMEQQLDGEDFDPRTAFFGDRPSMEDVDPRDMDAVERMRGMMEHMRGMGYGRGGFGGMFGGKHPGRDGRRPYPGDPAGGPHGRGCHPSTPPEKPDEA